jgi:hypothetical protein
MHKLVPLALLVVPTVILSGACLATPDAQGDGEAAEPIRMKPGQPSELTDCEKECLTFASEGCGNVDDQCDDDTGYAVAGPYVADCATAKRMACDGYNGLRHCMGVCSELPSSR